MGACISSKPKKNPSKRKESLKSTNTQVSTSLRRLSQEQTSLYRIEAFKIAESSSNLSKKSSSLNSLDSQDDSSDPMILNEDSRANTSLKSENEIGQKKLSFHRRRYLRKKATQKIEDSVSTMNATKYSEQLSHLMQNSEKCLFEAKEECKVEDVNVEVDVKYPDGINFENFGNSQKFINEMALNCLKKVDKNNTRQTGPKRLRQTSGLWNRLTVQPISYNGKFEISEVYENSAELAASSSLISLSNIEVNGLKSYDSSHKTTGMIKNLEALDLTNDGSKVHIFQVPFNQPFKQKEQISIKTVEINKFEVFYRSIHIEDKKNGASLLKFFPNRWKKGIVPYIIEKSLMFVTNSKNQSLFNLIISSIQDLQSKTIVKFIAFNPEKHQNFLHFSLGDKNQAFIGCQAGKNDIFVTQKAGKAEVLHQLMHSLGFFHEIQRKNKDSFIYLEKKHLKNPGFLEDGEHICLAGLNLGPFDLYSIMHYQSCDQMISYKPTVHDDEAGLSEVDIGKVNLFYSFDKSENEFLEDLNHLQVLANKAIFNKRVERSKHKSLILM
jgi:hypothetical protein